QPGLHSAHVILSPPVARERQHCRQLYALRRIGDELLARPSGRCHAAAQLVKVLLRDGDLEWVDVGMGHPALSFGTPPDFRAPCWYRCVPILLRRCSTAIEPYTLGVPRPFRLRGP